MLMFASEVGMTKTFYSSISTTKVKGSGQVVLFVPTILIQQFFETLGTTHSESFVLALYQLPSASTV